jgi:hypothetical protein
MILLKNVRKKLRRTLLFLQGKSETAVWLDSEFYNS